MLEQVDAAVPDFRRDIAGLRAVAILSVVLFHAGARLLPGGFTGVDIFFVISGFLIGGQIYAQAARKDFSFARFYRRRVKRILPALYVVLLTALTVGTFYLAPSEFRKLGRDIAASVLSVSNVVFWRGISYFDHRAADNPLLMTWSLSVEEQFYLVIPILMLLIARMRRRWVLVVLVSILAVSFVLSCVGLKGAQSADFYLLHTRAWELGIGVLLAVLQFHPGSPHREQGVWLSNLASAFGAALVILPFFLLNESSPFPGPGALSSTVGTAVLLWTQPSWINRRVLGHSWMVFIGQISYSWYLWHWLILTFLRLADRCPDLPLRWGLASAAISFGIAVLSYYFIESPFRASARPAKPLLLRYAAVGLTLVCLGAIVFHSRGVEWRYPGIANVDREIRTILVDPCLVDDGGVRPNLTEPCRPQSARTREVVVWGDSHAAALSPVLRAEAEQSQLAFVEYTKTGCPPLLGATREYHGDPNHAAECSQFNRNVLQMILNDPRAGTIVLEGAWAESLGLLKTDRAASGPVAADEPWIDSRSPEPDREALMVRALQRTMRTLRQNGRSVVVIGDVPSFEVDPVWRFHTSHISLRRAVAGLVLGRAFPIDPGSDAPKDNTAVLQGLRAHMASAASSQPGVRFWCPRTLLCDAQGRCRYRDKERMFYSDGSHLTPEGAMAAIQGLSLSDTLLAKQVGIAGAASPAMCSKGSLGCDAR